MPPEVEGQSVLNDSTASKNAKTLYDVLEIPKTATDDDIKRAYRKLALRYHPDKNLTNDQTTTEKFKEINHANNILSNPQKRKIYDDYGEMGLKMMDQLGEERMIYLLRPWVKWLFCSLFVLTCGCFGCFCCCLCGFKCCCNFCCGKCKPNIPEEDGYGTVFNNGPEEPIINQPTAMNNSYQATESTSNEPIVLGPPPPYSARDAASGSP